MTTGTDHTYHLPGDIDIAFTDSGPPPDSKDYTTLIIFHGASFTRESFEKLPKYVHFYNLRTVVVSRRGYPGATAYSEAELEELNLGKKSHLDKLGSLVASFVEEFVTQNETDLPKISSDGKSGGIAIIGYSIGAVTAMSMFADPALISPKSYTLLQKYMKDLIFYDSPAVAFGYPYLSEMYYPWLDKEASSPEEVDANSMMWLWSYYQHPNPHGPSTSLLDNRKCTDQRTTFRLEELERFYYKNSLVVEEPMLGPMQPPISSMAHQVLLNPTLAQTFFPNLKIIYLTCTRAPWICVWGAIETRRIYVEEYMKLPKSENLRMLEFVPVDGANHLAHWDDPELFLDAVVEGVRGERYAS